jgi:uncharacterized RDD family membrane protein YckC
VTAAPSAGLGRRALSLLYEALLAAAVVLAGALPFVLLTHGMDPARARPLFQLYLATLAGAYFSWQWKHGGRTLAMRTWRLRVVTRAGTPLTWAHAAKRYLYALAGTLALGAGFLWAFFDRDGLFLHDRLAGTRIIKSEVESRKSEGNP